MFLCRQDWRMKHETMIRLLSTVELSELVQFDILWRGLLAMVCWVQLPLHSLKVSSQLQTCHFMIRGLPTKKKTTSNHYAGPFRAIQGLQISLFQWRSTSSSGSIWRYLSWDVMRMWLSWGTKPVLESLVKQSRYGMISVIDIQVPTLKIKQTVSNSGKNWHVAPWIVLGVI